MKINFKLCCGFVLVVLNSFSPWLLRHYFGVTGAFVGYLLCFVGGWIAGLLIAKGLKESAQDKADYNFEIRQPKEEDGQR